MGQTKVYAIIEVDSCGILEQMRLIEKKAFELGEEVSKMRDIARHIKVIEKQGTQNNSLQDKITHLNESH